MTRSRNCLQVLRKMRLVPLALVAAMALACSDQPTQPSTALSSDLSAGLGASGKSSGAVSTLEWQKSARDLVKSHGVSPINAVRIYALHSVAQYAAVVAVDQGENGVGRASYEAQRGAIAGASAQVLSFIFPDSAAFLEAQVVADGNASPGDTHPHFTRGVAAGRAAGDAMKAWARADGFSLVWNESMRNAPGVGVWEGATAAPPAARPAPAGYQFPTMTPYFLKAFNGHTAQSQFRSASPPAYSLVAGTPFQTGLAEVRDVFLHRTQQQIDIANFWNLNVGTVTALGHWDEQAALYIAESQLDERAASHLYALMNAATMDATIGCWETKYHYLVVRPSKADPTAVPQITTVYPLPNHPSYPSGHSCVSAAAITILSSYFPAHAGELETGLAEAGMSRIYGGIHYRFDIEAGQTLGRQTAAWAQEYDRQHGLLTAVGLSGH
jgi:hypothetical protein